eukprot:TRINITY_DN3259_c0_g1_i6.p3 TRINITY_DN3259_c0_g1~~TRINITY_DN3259_c0_g1_i6.p3  ORF type:complete len:218 (+),score=-30.31 TRINITY_DN3259_c0_g1_i6:1550-2203(+)
MEQYFSSYALQQFKHKKSIHGIFIPPHSPRKCFTKYLRRTYYIHIVLRFNLDNAVVFETYLLHIVLRFNPDNAIIFETYLLQIVSRFNPDNAMLKSRQRSNQDTKLSTLNAIVFETYLLHIVLCLNPDNALIKTQNYLLQTLQYLRRTYYIQCYAQIPITLQSRHKIFYLKPKFYLQSRVYGSKTIRVNEVGLKSSLSDNIFGFDSLFINTKNNSNY